MKIKTISVMTLALVMVLLVSPVLAMGQLNMAASMTIYTVGDIVDITYERKVDKLYMFEGGIASYTYYASNSACGPVAGSEILGYYDRLYPDLIPSFASTYLYNGKLSYAPRNPTVDKVTAELNKLMNADDGTTSSEFKSGLTSYVKSKGLKTTYTNIMNTFLGINISFNFQNYKAAIDAGIPVFLGLKKHHIASITSKTSSKLDYHSYMVTNLSHAMVGCGYRVIEYYRTETRSVWSPVWYNLLRFETVKEEVNFRTDTFLLAATGTEMIMYLNINKDVQIAEAFSVRIHA